MKINIMTGGLATNVYGIYTYVFVHPLHTLMGLKGSLFFPPSCTRCWGSGLLVFFFSIFKYVLVYVGTVYIRECIGNT